MRRRFLLVHNPIAGLNGRRLVHEVTAGLQHLGADVTTHVGGPQTLPAMLRDHSNDFDAVIAAGGDGTIRMLAAELEPYGLPIGVVPMGTGNVLSHEIGLPKSAVGLADLLLHGPIREFTGGRANSEPFFLMAGVGFDGEVISHLDTPLKRRIGKAAYVSPFLKALQGTRTPLLVDIEGQRHEVQWLVVANARRYGGAFIIAPQAGLERPGLVAVLIRNAGQLGLIRQLLALGTGSLHRARGVEAIPCTHLTVQSATPIACQIDGDPFVPTPLTITAGNASVRLIVPERYAAHIDRGEDLADAPAV